MEESRPLTTTDGLYTKRVESGATMQSLETILAYATLLLAVAAGAVCVVMGLKGPKDHILMGITILLAAAHFAWMARMYKNDILQERKIVYFGCFIIILLSTTGLLYATGWKLDSGPTGSVAPAGCTGYFTADGKCLNFNVPVNYTNKCFAMIPDNTHQGGKYFNAYFLPHSNNVTGLTCNMTSQWAQLCTNAKSVPYRCECPAPPAPPKLL